MSFESCEHSPKRRPAGAGQRPELLILSILLFLAPAALNAFVGVDRGELLFKLLPGHGAASTVNVTNSGTGLSTVSLSIEDFKITDGRPNFNAQEHSRALASRLTVFPTSFELKAGESREVQVLLDPGDGPFEAGTYWAVVFVQTSRLADMVPPGGDRQVEVRVVERVGVFAFADAEPEPRPLPADVEITGLENAGKNLVISVKNPSRYLRLVTEGYVLATPLDGGAAQRWPMQTFRVLPDSTVRMEIPVPETAAGLGRCNVLVALDYGAEELVAGEQEFEF
jgi:P pilus assembly chaperone PapD